MVFSVIGERSESVRFPYRMVVAIDNKSKMNDEEITVRMMKPSEIAEVENLLELAFMDNPLTRILFGGRPKEGRISRLSMELVRNKHVRTFVAVSEEQIIGFLKEVDWPECRPRVFNLLSLWDTILALEMARFRIAAPV